MNYINYLKLIGLCVAGLLISASLTICIMACYKNKSLSETCSDDIFFIGASRFYGKNLDGVNEIRYSDGMSNPIIQSESNSEQALR